MKKNIEEMMAKYLSEAEMINVSLEVGKDIVPQDKTSEYRLKIIEVSREKAEEKAFFVSSQSEVTWMNSQKIYVHFQNASISKNFLSNNGSVQASLPRKVAEELFKKMKPKKYYSVTPSYRQGSSGSFSTGDTIYISGDLKMPR